jgi:hypothetical protein
MNYGFQMPQMQPQMPQYLGDPMYGGDQMLFGGPSPYAGQQPPQFMGPGMRNGYPQLQTQGGVRRPHRMGRFTPFMESTNPFAAIE